MFGAKTQALQKRAPAGLSAPQSGQAPCEPSRGSELSGSPPDAQLNLSDGALKRDRAFALEPHSGTLHLRGYDHKNRKDAANMESLEIRILKELGFPNPYVS